MNYHVYRNRSSIKIEEKLGSRIELLQRSPFVVSSANARPYRGQQFRDIDAGPSTGGAASYRFTRLSASDQGTGLKIVPENTTRGNSIAARP